jgi:hypothetical protein
VEFPKGITLQRGVSANGKSDTVFNGFGRSTLSRRHVRPCVLRPRSAAFTPLHRPTIQHFCRRSLVNAHAPEWKSTLQNISRNFSPPPPEINRECPTWTDRLRILSSSAGQARYRNENSFT